MQGNPNALATDRFLAFVPAGSTITITIGRNVGDKPLSDARWLEFQSRAADRVGALVRPAHVFTYHGQGEWDGVTEDSAAIVLVETGYTTNALDVKEVLATLAAEYRQDAIGFTYGAGHLVAANA